MDAAIRAGLEVTMAGAVNHAKSHHPWKNVTGTAEGSIMMRPPVQMGNSFVGQWGSFDVSYFIFLEVGTSRMSARPALRPAADAWYPKLAGLIRSRF